MAPAISMPIEAVARERGLRKLSLGVFPDNERAIAVYEKRGFVREGLRRMQYRSGGAFRDEVLMAWFPQESPGRAGCRGDTQSRGTPPVCPPNQQRRGRVGGPRERPRNIPARPQPSA